jgi:hypothetical protein
MAASRYAGNQPFLFDAAIADTERLTETPRRKGRDRTGDIKTSLNSQYTAVGEPAGGGDPLIHLLQYAVFNLT